MEAEFEKDYVYEVNQNHDQDLLLEPEQIFDGFCGLYIKENTR